MAQITPPPLTAPPAAPSTSNPTGFAAMADAFIAWIATFVTQVGDLAANLYGNAVDAFNSATDSSASAAASAASAVQAAASSGISMWVSGTAYTAGQGRWSPLNYQSYRRKTDGAGTIDPSADHANWALIGSRYPWVIKATNYVAVPEDSMSADTRLAPITITLPATPAENDSVRIMDYAGTFAQNNITIGRNGSNIMGLAENMTVSTNNVSLTLTFIDATQGWRIT